MAQYLNPFTGKPLGWDDGENGWGQPLNSTLIQYAFYLNRNVKGILASPDLLPVSPNDGDAYLVVSNARVYYYSKQWYNDIPPEGMKFRLTTTGKYFTKQGANFVQDEEFANVAHSGNAGDLTGKLSYNVIPEFIGDVTKPENSAQLTLTNTGVVAGSYGLTTGLSFPRFTVDAKGRITSVVNQLIPNATTTTSGLMSGADKTKLNGLAVQVNSDWNSVSGFSQILNKPTLGTAAALNAQSNITDTTPNRLMRVGAGGLLGNTEDSSTTGEFDATRFFRATSSDPSIPTALNYHGLHINHNGGNQAARILVSDTNSGLSPLQSVGFQSRSSTGVWSDIAWVYTTANTSPSVQTLLAATNVADITAVVGSATESTKGTVQLATEEETFNQSSGAKAVHPEGLSRYVRSVATIADLQALPSANNGQTFIVQSGTNTGEFVYNSSGSGSASFNNIVPNTLSGRFEKIDSSSALVVVGSATQRLDDAFDDLDNRTGSLESNSANKSLTNVTEFADANLFDSTEIVVDTPVGFPWSPSFAIYRNRSGRFRCSLDPTLFMPRSPTTVLYVNKLAGSDSNEGTELAPKKTLAGALSSSAYTGGSGGCIIYLSEGVYYATEGLSSTDHLIIRDTAIICPKGVARLTAFPDPSSLTWSQQPSPNTSVYRTTLASFGNWVFDSDVLTEDGHYSRLTRVDSIDECQDTPRSFCSLEGDNFVYVNTGEASAPGSNILLNRSTAANTAHMTDSAAYFENISFEGGDRMATLGSATSKPVVFNNCAFRYMVGNGSEINGRGGLSILYKCRSSHNGRDGFSYRYAGSDAAMRAIEIDCIAENNGWTDSYSNNGSTCHSYSYLIRVNGFYDRNQDRNVHDVHSSRSWNLGCYSGRPRRETLDPWRSFNWGSGRAEEADDTVMWLDSCTSQGGVVDLYAGIDCKIFTRRMSAKTSAGVGDIMPY